MKKIIILLLIICFVVVIIAQTPTQGLKFRLIDNNTAYEVDLEHSIVSVKNLIIPSSYNGLPVTKIKEWDEYPFLWTDNDSEKLMLQIESVFIPESITSIGYYAFRYCSKLTSVNIPASVKEIWHSVFSGCSSLESITVDERNKVFKSEGNCLININTKELIRGCRNSIIPDDVESISYEAFSYVKNMTEIIIPKNVKSICYKAFIYSDLSKIILSDGLINIDEGAFARCENLTDVILPSSLERIGRDAFGGCISLKAVFIPKSVTHISVEVFWGCNNLRLFCEPTSKPDGWDETWNVKVHGNGKNVKNTYIPTLWGVSKK